MNFKVYQEEMKELWDAIQDMLDNVATVKIRIVVFCYKFPIKDSWKWVQNATIEPIKLQ